MKYIFISIFVFFTLINSYGESKKGNIFKINKIQLEHICNEGEAHEHEDTISHKSIIPEITLIVDFSFLNRNLNNDIFSSLEIPGFMNPHEEDNEQTHDNSESGFNFNYAELSLVSSIDHYFDLFTTFHISENTIEVEEAYVTTNSLIEGIQIKFGKFKSNFGRINALHPHYWNFYNQPLIYNVFFGEEGLNELGIQLNWVAPIDTYLLLGIESLQGENEVSYGTDGYQFEEIKINDTSKPNLFTYYIKSSIDFGNGTVLYGVSYAKGETRLNNILNDPEHIEESYFFTGNTNVLGIEFANKYFIDTHRYIAFTTEYLSRKMNGIKYTEEKTNNFNKKQSGFYCELLFKFSQKWKTGFRYESINKNEIKADGLLNILPENLNKSSFMVEYNISEFSRIRLQYDINKTLFLEDIQKDVNEISLQLNFTLGAHKAHKF